MPLLYVLRKESRGKAKLNETQKRRCLTVRRMKNSSWQTFPGHPSVELGTTKLYADKFFFLEGEWRDGGKPWLPIGSL